jgi:hypothetical protein
MVRRRLKLFLKIVLTCVVLLFLFLVFERVRGQISLARYRRELISKGERLDAKTFRPPVNADENGAPEIYKAIAELKDGGVLHKHPPPLMTVLPSGRAVVGFREASWLDEKVTNDWDEVAADLQTNDAPLAQIRAGLQKPILRNDVDFSQGFKMDFRHIVPAKSTSQWFEAAALLRLHEGKTHESVDGFLTEMETARLLSDDRLAISELVRIAILAISRGATWEALQADGWTDDDLARIQAAWEKQSFATPMAVCMEGERIFDDSSYDILRKSNEETVHVIWENVFADYGAEDKGLGWEGTLNQLPGYKATMDFLKQQVYCRIWRFAWSHQSQRHSLEQMQRLIEVSRTAADGKSLAEVQPAIAQIATSADHQNWYDSIRYPMPESVLTLAHVVTKATQAETERSMILCAIALKRFALKHGKSPETLDALVPEFLSAVPTDWMDGRPLKYHLNADESFTLYSVGLDGKDNGGDTAPSPGKESNRNLWYRTDFVWPSPALSNELSAWREESAKN